MASWTDDEFEDISFGDARLNQRFLKIAGKFLEKPSATISESTGNWAESKASYRFFGNEKVTKEEILDQHFAQTMERIRQVSGRTLAIQDTTYLDYTHHPQTEELGPLTRSPKKKSPQVGLVLHSTLAISLQGECLGLLNQKIYRRSAQIRSRKKTPIEEKESFRWIEPIKRIDTAFSQSSKIVYVCDREGDIFEFFSEVTHQSASSFLVRAGKDRVVGKRFSRNYADQGKNIKLWQFMEQQPIAGRVEIPMRRPLQTKRTAICEVRYSPISYPAPYRHPEARSGEMKPVDLYAVWIKEINYPPESLPIEWMLLTNIPIQSFEGALEKIDWYKARWHIENYHKVLKSGCNIEHSKLNHADKLERFAALMSVIAARVYQLKLTGRSYPDEPCTRVLDTEEWKVLYRFIHKTKKLPEKTPSAKEAMLWIAKLGGFLGRKSDGNPGSIVIWRGWQRFMDIMESWKTFQLSATYG